MGKHPLIRRSFYLLCLTLLLNACAAPLLLMTPQGQLMWALLKPLVGLDPNDVGLFEQPIIKSRMQSLLGSQYGNTMKVLSTATEIQQQGPLFYVISNHSPIPEYAEKAGLVWDADTNQMAMVLLGGGSPQIFAEKLVKEQLDKEGNKQLAVITPKLPTELQDSINAAKALQDAIQNPSLVQPAVN